jgi:hypothetical protein
MSAPAPPTDLLDLKLLPAWVKESPTAHEYSNFEGEEADALPSRGKRGHDRPHRGERPRGREHDRRAADHHRPRRADHDRSEQSAPPLPAVSVRFLPYPPALENVTAQVKSGSLAYSVFALARLFLEKPERYDVRVIAQAETPLYQLGEHGPASSDRSLLESNAFSSVTEDFYKVEIVQSDPIKGSFSNVARCRASGTLLGPTNHHSYQSQLRNLYEQRFSRRMSFADYQRQIEIVSDPVAVEQWKEQARNITTYTTTRIEPPVKFSNAAEAERHFRQNYLPNLIRSAQEFTISGVLSRRLPDRALGRVIEDTWARETRSPSHMMQELAGALRHAGLNIFRHRRGMLFVSPIRLRAFGHERASVSPAINAILEKLAAAPGIHRKELAEQLSPATANGAGEQAKLALASNLHWLISEGYLIEFNDGSLDLPRIKSLNESKRANTSNEGSTAVPAVDQTPAPDPSAAPTST